MYLLISFDLFLLVYYFLSWAVFIRIRTSCSIYFPNSLKKKIGGIFDVKSSYFFFFIISGFSGLFRKIFHYPHVINQFS